MLKAEPSKILRVLPFLLYRDEYNKKSLQALSTSVKKRRYIAYVPKYFSNFDTAFFACCNIMHYNNLNRRKQNYI